jgi:hypothetical protein
MLYVRSFLGFLEYLGCYDILASPSWYITGELLPALSNYGSGWQVASLILIMRMRLWFSLKTLDLGDEVHNRTVVWYEMLITIILEKRKSLVEWGMHAVTWEEKVPFMAAMAAKPTVKQERDGSMKPLLSFDSMASRPVLVEQTTWHHWSAKIENVTGVLQWSLIKSSVYHQKWFDCLISM